MFSFSRLIQLAVIPNFSAVHCDSIGVLIVCGGQVCRVVSVCVFVRYVCHNIRCSLQIAKV